jgi:hypothetical protein
MNTKAIALVNSFFIKNLKLKSCVECSHFTTNSSRIPKCKKFGEKDLVTNKIKYESAYVTRYTPNMCGQSGVYFESK